jgi:hypothetical protein
VWLPPKLKEQVAILKSQPEAVMVFGPVLWWYSWTGKPADAGRDFTSILPTPPDCLIPPPQLLIHLLRRETVTTTPALIRREALVEAGGFEESFRGLYEDQVVCAKLSSHASVFVAGQCWYRWRKHDESACSDALTRGGYRAARLSFLMWLQTYLQRQHKLAGQLSLALKVEIRKCRTSFVRRLWSRLRHG